MRNMLKYEQGEFSPKNTHKWFISAVQLEKSQIIKYRSSYEKQFYNFLDVCNYVKYICVEPFGIPYISIDGKTHRYFPDCVIRCLDGKTLLIEIKPLNKVKLNAKNITDKIIQEYEINQRKWREAKRLCDEHKWKFCIITENEINSHLLTSILKQL